jgi:HlyD family secretion protein
VKARLGETAVANSSLIIMSNPYAVEAETSVIEEDLPLVKTGQTVELFFDAQPEAAVVGKVDRIVPQRTSGDRPLYPVYIAPDDVPDDLVPGMTVDASIAIDSRSGVLRLPRAVVRARSDNSAIVKVWTGDHIADRTIKTGLRGDLYVEIVEGLQEGDQVVGE